MRTIHLTSVLAVLAALSACSNPVEPSTDPGSRPHEIGSYMGSGLSVGDATSTASYDSSSASRGPGYGGSGH